MGAGTCGLPDGQRSGQSAPDAFAALGAAAPGAVPSELQALSTPNFGRFPRRTSGAFHPELRALFTPNLGRFPRRPFNRPPPRTSSAFHALYRTPRPGPSTAARRWPAMRMDATSRCHAVRLATRRSRARSA